MEIIREIYQDYEIIINSTICKSDKIEMEIIVTPYIKGLYKLIWERNMVSMTWEQYSNKEEPDNSNDTMVIYYFEDFCRGQHNVYKESIEIPNNYKTNEVEKFIAQQYITTVKQDIDKKISNGISLQKLLLTHLMFRC